MFARGFLGVVPAKLIATIADLCQPQDWPAVYVACSGTFRTERGLLSRFPDLEVHSNDVSLFSTAIARAALNDPLPFTFKGELAFVEDCGLVEPADRISALLVALNYGTYAKGKTNRFKQAHLDHLRTHFGQYVKEGRAAVDKALKAMPIHSYFAGDFRDHMEAAIKCGAGVIAYPPTFKAGYEKLFAFVHENVDWTEPSYRMFDPADIGQVLERLKESGVPYFLYCDQELEGHEPQVQLEQRGKRPIFGFAKETKASFRDVSSHAKPFSYELLDLTRLSATSEVSIVPAPESALSFLREVYLKKTIAFGQGDYGVLVHLDGMLAGAVSYRKPPGMGMPLYVLSDFATTREGRLAKLIARLATLRATIRPFESRLVMRFPAIRTTAFSEHPEAMKYRGSWKVEKRTEVNQPAGRYAINYIAETRTETLQDCYAWWWKRDGEKQVAEARNRNQAGRPQDAQAA